MKTLTFAAIGVTFSMLLIFAAGCGSSKESAIDSQPSTGEKQVTIVIDNGVYTPSVIEAVKGQPLALSFKSGSNPGCGSTVVFKSLGIRKDVPKDAPVVIRFTPKESGEIAFTCGMDMFDGKVIVK